VDLISYEIKKMKPLELVELASGTGENARQSILCVLMRPKLALQVL
jgi:hypothetical protein